MCSAWRSILARARAQVRRERELDPLDLRLVQRGREEDRVGLRPGLALLLLDQVLLALEVLADVVDELRLVREQLRARDLGAPRGVEPLDVVRVRLLVLPVRLVLSPSSRSNSRSMSMSSSSVSKRTWRGQARTCGTIRKLAPLITLDGRLGSWSCDEADAAHRSDHRGLGIMRGVRKALVGLWCCAGRARRPVAVDIAERRARELRAPAAARADAANASAARARSRASTCSASATRARTTCGTSSRRTCAASCTAARAGSTRCSTRPARRVGSVTACSTAPAAVPTAPSRRARSPRAERRRPTPHPAAAAAAAGARGADRRRRDRARRVRLGGLDVPQAVDEATRATRVLPGAGTRAGLAAFLRAPWESRIAYDRGSMRDAAWAACVPARRARAAAAAPARPAARTAGRRRARRGPSATRRRARRARSAKLRALRDAAVGRRAASLAGAPARGAVRGAARRARDRRARLAAALRAELLRRRRSRRRR